ncbi:MAG: serine hydrolase domain-containing protein, partial [Thermomicrobiales bacterium]
ISGREIWDVAWDRIFEPIALYNVVARPGPALDGRIAHVADTARPGTDVESYNSVYWRSLGIPWGGLYGSVRDVVRFAGSFLPGGSPFLSAASVRAMTSDQVRGVPGGVGSLKLRWPRAYWGLGWEVKGTKTRHWTGELTSPKTFCHFGAAGTLVWSDPERNVALAVFGNRMTVHRWPFVPARWAQLSNAVVSAVA